MTLFASTNDLARFTHEALPAIDADGQLGVVERAQDQRRARVLLDSYLLGSSRESSAAAELIEAARHAL